MPHTQSRLHSPLSRHSVAELGPVAGLTCASIVIVLMAAFGHPHPLVLPMLSAFLVAVGFTLAGAAYISHRWRAGPGETAPLEERMILPGLLVFGGFAAGFLTDADSVLLALGIAH